MQAKMQILNKRSMGAAPRDGTPVFLVLRDAFEEWRSARPFTWSGRAWVSVETRLPIRSQLRIVGWLPESDVEADESALAPELA